MGGNSPHVHSVDEVKANIKKVEHNSDGAFGPPSGSGGGSGSVQNVGNQPQVTSTKKGDDWVGKRKY